jgi:hypothetical protein
LKTYCLACLRPTSPSTADLCVHCSVYWAGMLASGCSQCNVYREVLEDALAKFAKQRSGEAA